MNSEARKKAVQKYNEKTYEQVKLRVKKGEKEKIRIHAESKGKSINGYINELIQNDMKN